jgi:hypothetical protein
MSVDVQSCLAENPIADDPTLVEQPLMSKAPIFQSIFGVPWSDLPSVMQKHYAVRPDSHDRVVVRGTMTISRSRLMRLLAPLLRFFGALVPYDGEGIPATVTFTSGPGSSDFHFDRIFEPPGKPAFLFHSRLVQISESDVIELMRFGIGWRSRYRIDGNHVSLSHIGYFWRIGKMLIPLPMTWILGRGAAAEDVVNDNSFTMWMTITHPLLGEIYRYEGIFEVTEVTCG